MSSLNVKLELQMLGQLLVQLGGRYTPGDQAGLERRAVLFLPYREHGIARFLSVRTGETLFEIRMFHGAIIVWGEHYRPDECDAGLYGDGRSVSVCGTLRDKLGAVVTFGDHVDVLAPYALEFDQLPADFDGTWRRDLT